MRVLQLSDPHLLADPAGCYRARQPLAQLRQALEQTLGAGGSVGELGGERPDVLLISGDLCQDESWGGYINLRDQLGAVCPGPGRPQLALLPGNHDHPQLLRAALGRQAWIAPAELRLAGARLLLLDSHWPGQLAGRLGPRQLAWLRDRLAVGTAAEPLLVALHHPPVPIGDPGMDAIALVDGPELLDLLADAAGLQAVVFGHIHQHWLGHLPGRAAVPLLGCPSSLCPFPAVQACPQGRAQDPGGRLLTLSPTGLRQRLLRWAPAVVPSVG
ncbi:metallophosphoesterase [Synechococcus sp. CBW1002]|uniref:metallophosphoesterase n=1 Tax=Synechococcus sp. CBW1002 TaxID=1353134 RepID=UPI0018CF42F4|nr:metallophosphoesterase [Synechococcus sp. CBW1002]QPN60162.1 metallophosphoesterase [Synechococcus sp. CBW1002]